MIFDILLAEYKANTGVVVADPGIVDMFGAISDFVESDPTQVGATEHELSLLIKILQNASKTLTA